MDEQLEKFAKLPQKQKLGVLLGIIVALGVAHYMVVFKGQKTKMADILTKSKKFEAELVEKQAIAENLDKYQNEVRKLEIDLERAKTLLPDKSEVQGLLSQISTLASKSGLEISRFEPQHDEMMDFYVKMPFKVVVSGGYHEIASFIDNVGKLERIVNVENITMKDPKMANKRYVVASEFQVITYRFVERKDDGGGGGGAGEKPKKGKGFKK